MVIATGQQMLADDINNLTFFPKGTILTFSSEAWNATAPAFQNIWKVCNAANHAANSAIPDLTGRFLRGAESSGSPGGADSQKIDVSLREHNHTFTGDNQTGSFYIYELDTWAHTGVFSGSTVSNDGHATNNIGGTRACPTIRFSMTPTGTVSTVGSRKNDEVTVNTVPSYYAVIYIMKVV